jgi:rRNA maturation endonuclease Nob1
MSDVLVPVVYCAACGTVLFESASVRDEEREPCPACGSARRRVQNVTSGAETRAA